ncbi:MAG: hypothetical protein HZA52_11225 [Planctomycetes bacterium]|nr:hypothetical protein [Planctomycetota bacterium]
MLLTLLLLFLADPASLAASATIPGQQPTITIAFAGNRADDGGPYWRPPGESTPLADDGYYVDGSKQVEDWMEIEVDAVDPDQPSNPLAIQSVKLRWLGASDPAFPPLLLSQHFFTRLNGFRWRLRTDQLPVPIMTQEGMHYTFEVVALDSNGDSATAKWEKIAPHSTPSNPIYARRFVQLGCTPVDLSYRPYYLRVGDYGLITADDRGTHDRYRHDTGPEMGYFDTGELSSFLPTNVVEQRWCQQLTAYWFGDKVCVDEFTLSNVYFHTWMSTMLPVRDFEIGWKKTRGNSGTGAWLDFFTWNHAQAHTFVEYTGNPETSSNYGLMTRLMDTQETTFTDNTIHELLISTQQFAFRPSTICSRRSVSFVIFNVPEDEQVLRSLDTDGDGLDDYAELYETYTSPFLTDTDADNRPDDFEIGQGTDPNVFDPKPDDDDPLPDEQG